MTKLNNLFNLKVQMVGWKIPRNHEEDNLAETFARPIHPNTSASGNLFLWNVADGDEEE
jgi:hypothetical protein